MALPRKVSEEAKPEKVVGGGMGKREATENCFGWKRIWKWQKKIIVCKAGTSVKSFVLSSSKNDDNVS